MPVYNKKTCSTQSFIKERACPHPKGRPPPHNCALAHQAHSSTALVGLDWGRGLSGVSCVVVGQVYELLSLSATEHPTFTFGAVPQNSRARVQGSPGDAVGAWSRPATDTSACEQPVMLP